MLAVSNSSSSMPASNTHVVSQFESLKNASSEHQAVSLLAKTVKSLGFDQMLFAIFPKSGAKPADAYIRSTYPDSWRTSYDRHALGAYDPIVAHCYKCKQPLVWRPELFQQSPTHSMYDETGLLSIRAGVTLPIHGPKGEVGMLNCERDQAPGEAFQREVDQKLGTLALLRDIAFDVLSPHISPREHGEEPPKLTAREFDCLQWMAAGKTAWEIGRILNISEAGVNFHISNLRGKFGVTRRTDVVVKAIKMGLVTPP